MTEAEIERAERAKIDKANAKKAKEKYRRDVKKHPFDPRGRKATPKTKHEG